MATVKVNKHLLYSGQITFNFSWEGEPLPEDVEKVNLSRHGLNPNCWFRLDRVSDHDSHSPILL